MFSFLPTCLSSFQFNQNFLSRVFICTEGFVFKYRLIFYLFFFLRFSFQCFRWRWAIFKNDRENNASPWGGRHYPHRQSVRAQSQNSRSVLCKSESRKILPTNNAKLNIRVLFKTPYSFKDFWFSLVKEEQKEDFLFISIYQMKKEFVQ